MSAIGGGCLASTVTVPPKSLGMVLAHIRAGGLAFIPTYAGCTVIDSKSLAAWERAGIELLREDGDGYRMTRGRKSVYLLPGQLKLSTP